MCLQVEILSLKARRKDDVSRIGIPRVIEKPFDDFVEVLKPATCRINESTRARWGDASSCSPRCGGASPRAWDASVTWFALNKATHITFAATRVATAATAAMRGFACGIPDSKAGCGVESVQLLTRRRCALQLHPFQDELKRDATSPDSIVASGLIQFSPWNE